MDPVGALLGIAALTSGSRRMLVVLYGVIIVVVTVLVGTVLSVTTASISFGDLWALLDFPDPAWAIGQSALGLLLIALGIKRWRNRHDAEESPPKRRLGNPLLLIGTGLLFGLTAPTDPTFIALSIVAARADGIVPIVAAHSLWILISQLPLVTLVIAILFNKHHAVTDRIQSGWARIRPYFANVLTGVVSAAGAFLVLEVTWWLTVGEWIVG